MENNVENKPRSLKKALGYSFLICLAGAIIYAILFYFGLSPGIIASLTAYLMMWIYLKHYPKRNAFCFIWILGISLILYLAVTVNNSIMNSMKMYNLSYVEVIKQVISDYRYAVMYLPAVVKVLMFTVTGVVTHFFADKVKKRKMVNKIATKILPIDAINFDKKDSKGTTNTTIQQDDNPAKNEDADDIVQEIENEE